MSMEKAEPEPIKATVSDNGRVVIPEPMRWYLNINKSDKLKFKLDGKKLIVEKANEG